ncbi:MAG: flagellar export chaperone FlgN [Phycisphaerales bacterium]|nr:flagellar export chaperone FlgN [Phycisphaerales bacterium]
MTATLSFERPGVRSASIGALAERLDACLGELLGLLTRLGEAAGQRLAALRRADTEALRSTGEEEERVLARTAQVEQARAAILADLAQALHLPTAEPPRLEMLAERLQEPISSRIRARCAGLRSAAEILKKNTRLTADVAQRLQLHIRAVLAELAGVNREPIGYGAGGRTESCVARSWVDALG